MQPGRRSRLAVAGGGEDRAARAMRVIATAAMTTLRSRFVSRRRGVLTRWKCPSSGIAAQVNGSIAGPNRQSGEPLGRSLDSCTWWRRRGDGRLTASHWALRAGGKLLAIGSPRQERKHRIYGMVERRRQLMAAHRRDPGRPDEHPGAGRSLRRRDAEALVGELDDDGLCRLRDRAHPLVPVRVQNGLREPDAHLRGERQRLPGEYVGPARLDPEQRQRARTRRTSPCYPWYPKKSNSRSRRSPTSRSSSPRSRRS